MAETVTNRGKLRIANTIFGAAVPDLRMCYFSGTAAGTADPDLNTVADLEAVTSVVVAAERIALTTETIAEDDTNNRVNFDADTVAFSAAPGVTAQGVAIYVHNAGGDALCDIIAIYTTGFPQPVDGGLNVNITDYLRMA